jgi:hypothetical protein
MQYICVWINKAQGFSILSFILNIGLFSFIVIYILKIMIMWCLILFELFEFEFEFKLNSFSYLNFTSW